MSMNGMNWTLKQIFVSKNHNCQQWFLWTLGLVHKLRLQDEVGRWSKKMFTFCQSLYPKICQYRGVGGQNKPLSCQRGLWTTPYAVILFQPKYVMTNSQYPEIALKFIYSEKATKFCEISTLLLSYVVPVRSKVEISQNFAAFSEYMTFI